MTIALGVALAWLASAAGKACKALWVELFEVIYMYVVASEEEGGTGEEKAERVLSWVVEYVANNWKWSNVFSWLVRYVANQMITEIVDELNKASEKLGTGKDWLCMGAKSIHEIRSLS